MKKLYMAICLMMITVYGFTQVSPDFSFFDSNGNSHSLYQELANGYTVVLGFSDAMVDCFHCWDKMKKLQTQIYTYYNSHPGNVTVWGIFGNTDTANVNLFKDTACIQYPIGGIEGGSQNVINIFGSSGYYLIAIPQLAIICPDTIITWDIWPSDDYYTNIKNIIESQCFTTGIFHQAENTSFINVFPNPVSDNLTIETSAKSSIEILNIEGQIIKTTNTAVKQTSIDVSNLSSGVYIIKAKTDRGFAVKKLIKE